MTESEPYKALDELARAASKWTQFKRNLPPDGEKRGLKQLTSRHSDLAHSLKTGQLYNPVARLKQVIWKTFSHPILVE